MITGPYFINFFIFIIIKYFLNSKVLKGISVSYKPIKNIIVFKPCAGYNLGTQARYVLLLSRLMVFVQNDLSYNIEGLFVFIVFSSGLILEISLFFKKTKINQLWVLLSDCFLFFIIFYSVFIYKGVCIPFV